MNYSPRRDQAGVSQFTQAAIHRAEVEELHFPYYRGRRKGASGVKTPFLEQRQHFRTFRRLLFRQKAPSSSRPWATFSSHREPWLRATSEHPSFPRTLARSVFFKFDDAFVSDRRCWSVAGGQLLQIDVLDPGPNTV